MKITRKDAIRIFCKITDRDDPYWMDLIEEHYDEKKDDWPTIYDVLEPLGVNKKEIDEAEMSG